MAEIYAEIDRKAEAATIYKQMLVQMPENSAVLNNLANVLIDTDAKEALSYAEKAVSLSPENANFKDTLAWLTYRSGEQLKALEILRSIAKEQQTPTIKYHLAEVLAGVGKNNEAIEILKALENEEFSEKQQASLIVVQTGKIMRR